MQRLVLNLSKRDVLGRIRQLLRNGRSLAHSVVQPKTTSERLQSSVLVEGFVPGKTLHGFNVKKVQEVPELCLTAVRLVHDGTGAEYLHLARDDRNNVFNVCFRTTPMDSTGVPHILEHTVLCGSERYPCRDPFFKMLNRSLATFMNALTGSDYTMYPFATQNPTDFQNLMKVYLDAVFAPHLRVLDFSQEGWRLEHHDVNDASSPIVFKGVVFNEMKGYFANSEQLFAQDQQNRLLPTHTYAHISGGDPIHIPDLTWENLRQFHASHYHPSNARFITYGDFPLEGHLELINERLQLFSRISVDTAVPNQARWTEPRSADIHCRPDPMLPNPEKNATVSIGYLLGNIADTQEAFTMQILSDLLVSGPNCPFYKSLLEPNIGSNYSPTIGYSGHTKEATFSVGLQGIHPNDIDKVTRIIDKTLDEVISSGFPEERIEAILHTIELSMKHVTTNFGLNLSMGVMPLWNHDCSVIQALQINEHIAKFRQNIRANPRLLQEKVEKCLKNNPHRLTLTMTPDAKYEEELKFKEEKKLAEKVKSLTESETRDVYNKGMELLAKQNEAEDISCLPTLLISDIEKVMKYTDIEVSTIGGVPVQICIQPTNGVTYFRGVLKTSGLPPHLRQYIPLFCSILTKLGTDELDYKQLSQRIDLKTGGLSVSSHIADNPLDLTTFEEGIRLYSHCLNKNVQDMFNLWEQIFNSVRFSDKDRLATLIAMMASDLASSIPDSGHSYAVSEASSGLTPAAALRERYGGMKMVTQMKQLAELKKLDEIIVALQEIGSWVLTRNQSRFAVNSTEEALPATLTALDKFLSKTSNSQVVAHTEPTPALLPSKCQYILPFPVHFVGKGIPGVPYCHQDFASLRVLAQLMTSKFLHKEIREKGGAYVGGASYGANGIFSFYSYRDPNNVRTLETFDRAINWAIDGKYTQQDLNEAKLSVFQTVDRPISPGDRGSRLFVSGISDAAVQAHREQLFSIEKHNLIQAAKQYVANSSRVGICILGPQNDAFKTEDGWDLRTDYS